ncbi:hypothetical protein [Bordetella genomosp. 7]|uniref:hypothetical protein n=1 Tax=Bordetella genomosp. 7 TaxID=1416805 RepID=UPI0014832944|nr:hypothetical protein [Bordetella genomosp. 7]
MAQMKVSQGGKLYGYKLTERAKIKPVPATTNKQRVVTDAKAVIKTHRDVLVALRDR